MNCYLTDNNNNNQEIQNVNRDIPNPILNNQVGNNYNNMLNNNLANTFSFNQYNKSPLQKQQDQINSNINIGNAFFGKCVSNYFINSFPDMTNINPMFIQNQMMYPQMYPQSKIDNMNPNYYMNQQTQMYQNPSIINKKKRKTKIKRIDPSFYVNVPISELSQSLVPLAKDQGGCRYLQKLLEEDPVGVTSELYVPLVNNIFNLVNDTFANYLVQKMFLTMNENQKEQIISLLSENLLEIGANSHGTRVLQSLINVLSSEKLILQFLNAMLPHVVELIKELNGTHVVQLFTKLYPQYSDKINQIIVKKSNELSKHRHGCCVMQKYLQTSDPEMLKNLISNLIENCLLLIVDQFGNYVIQSILLMRNINYGNQIAEKITENVCFFAKHKYSSNVVEKCLDHCDGTARDKLIDKLSLPESIQSLILDEHGNYIVQKVICISSTEKQSTIINSIIPLISKIASLNFGERILNKLTLIYPPFKEIRNRSSASNISV